MSKTWFASRLVPQSAVGFSKVLTFDFWAHQCQTLIVFLLERSVSLRKQIQLFKNRVRFCFIQKRYRMYFRLFILVNYFLNCKSYIFKMQAPRNTISMQEYRSYEIIDDKGGYESYGMIHTVWFLLYESILLIQWLMRHCLWLNVYEQCIQ